MKKLTIFCIGALMSISAIAGLHDKYDTLLKKYVSTNGNVDYNGMKKEHNVLKSYLVELDKNKPVNSDPVDQQLAYWINLYNAHTLNLILDHYPVKSITDIYNGKPWDQKIIQFGDKMLSLNQVENEIIRPEFKEPRIHFAVNCAAISCPKLLNEAYTGDKLDDQLTKQTKQFLVNTQKNTIAANEVKLSKIFEWYRGDFEQNGTLIHFLNKYSSVTIDTKANIGYLEYDWSLNK